MVCHIILIALSWGTLSQNLPPPFLNNSHTDIKQWFYLTLSVPILSLKDQISRKKAKNLTKLQDISSRYQFLAPKLIWSQDFQELLIILSKLSEIPNYQLSEYHCCICVYFSHVWLQLYQNQKDFILQLQQWLLKGRSYVFFSTNIFKRN